MANRQITRRILIGAVITTILLCFFLVRPQNSPNPAIRSSSQGQVANGQVTNPEPAALTNPDVTKGEVVMPKLGNETAKAELGRATWKYFHTMLARYPEEPTTEQQETLRSFIYLFARLYPCGECASHFQGHLVKYPPQVASRNIASGWGCFIHNEVNAMLKKPEFDCNKIGDFYDCGCADDEKSDDKKEDLQSRNQDDSPEQSEKNRMV